MSSCISFSFYRRLHFRLLHASSMFICSKRSRSISFSPSQNKSEPEVMGLAPSFWCVSAKPSCQHRNTHQNRCALAPKKLRSFIGLNIDSFSIASSRIGHNSHTATFRRSRAAFPLPHPYSSIAVRENEFTPANISEYDLRIKI